MTTDHDAFSAPDAEAHLLGAILIDPSSYDDVAWNVTSSAFSTTINRTIWRLMGALVKQGRPIDPVLLSEGLSRSQDRDYVSDLCACVSTSTHILHYAERVREAATRRVLRAAAENAISDLADSSRKPGDVADTLTGAVADAVREDSQKSVSGWQAVEMALRQAEAAQKDDRDVLGLTTGLPRLDRILCGLERQLLYILAARPSDGKSALALQITEAAARGGASCLFFSLEMPDLQLGRRLLSGMSGLSSSAIKRGRISPSEWQQLVSKQAESQPWLRNIEFVLSARMTPAGILSWARKAKRQGGCDLIVVDYLTKLRHHDPEMRRQRYREVGDFAALLKEYAALLDVPVLALAQIGRDYEKRGQDARTASRGRKEPALPPPSMADLRESGDLEQDADAIMFLHRPDPTEKTINDPEVTVEIIVAKQRDGARGKVTTTFRRDLVRFEEKGQTSA